METIILVIHLILALSIIGLVMIQRSSGGGLGIGGGGAGDFASAKGTANVLTKLTTYFAIAFFATSLSLGYIAANNDEGGVLDALEAQEAVVEVPVEVAPAEPSVPVAE